jgi:hypothetical protein
MYSDTKITRSVADAVEKILNPQPIAEELKGGQKKLDKNHNGKLDGQDFKILRGQKTEVKKEEVEQQDEAMSHQAKTTMKHIPNPSPALKKAAKDIKPGVGGYRDRIDMLKAGGVKEEVESIDEVKMADLPSTKVQGRSYGASKPESDYVKGPSDAELKKIEAEKKKKKFSEMINLYQEKGLKALSEMTVKEGASEDQWNAQVEVAKFKSNTKDDDTVRPVKKKTNVATPLEVATKNEEVEIVEYPLDVDAINGASIETIEERSLTSDETKKKEEIVKSMKKGMAGFKERYGDRAKSVMYATATKNAKGD